MTEYELRQQYFGWLLKLVNAEAYSDLLSYFDLRTFEYSCPMDENRFSDGEELRYRFGQEEGIEQAFIASCLDIRPCSFLEMTVALAVRCEESIMHVDEDGNRTGLWYMQMLESMGVEAMTDGYFDEYAAAMAVDRVLYRTYSRDGQGGLFYVKDCLQDMRYLEIWNQLMIFLNDYIRFTNAYRMPEIKGV